MDYFDFITFIGGLCMRCKHPHFCNNWDGLFIVPGDLKFENCYCHCNGTEPNYFEMQFILNDRERNELNTWLAKRDKHE